MIGKHLPALSDFVVGRDPSGGQRLALDFLVPSHPLLLGSGLVLFDDILEGSFPVIVGDIHFVMMSPM